jgi:hypothetical protein
MRNGGGGGGGQGAVRSWLLICASFSARGASARGGSGGDGGGFSLAVGARRFLLGGIASAPR